MLRRLTGAVAFVCLFALMPAPVAESDPARTAAMQFALRQESGVCGESCRVLVSAAGMIRPDTVRDFEAFAATADLRGATLVLNSEGGSVHGALALGRAVRRLGLTTTVGRVLEPSAKTGNRVTLSPRADCESMCAFVLLGGSRRFVPDEARVSVHQIWLGDRRDDAAAATYSAEDLVLVQRDIGKLAQYTIEMGGTAELLEVSLRVPPWEPMRTLTRAELRRMQLDNAQSDTTPAAAPLVTSAAPATTGSLRRGAAGGERSGWTLSGRGGEAALTRSHPLTVEGETLGRFDLSISCGDKPNQYRVTYGETRRAGVGGAAPQPLREVQLRFGYKTVTLAPVFEPVPLPVFAAPDAAGRAAAASGTLTAAVVTGFAGAGSRSLSVVATGADGASTHIRIGNTGLAQYAPQLAAACAQPRIEHAEAKPAR